MNDKSALLGQLKIERDDTPASGKGWLWALGAALLIAAGAVWVLFLRGPDAVQVKVVTARALSASAAANASVLDASGYVVARRQATVSSKITGKVTEVLIEEGQRVKAGDVLARIDDSNTRAQVELARAQLNAAQAQLAEVQVQLAEAERQLSRSRELAEKKLLSQQQLESAQASVDAQKARLASVQQGVAVADRGLKVQSGFLDDTIVRAPFDGVITQKNAQPGEMISPLSAGGAGTRTGIGTLVDMDSLEIEVDVNENFINRVQPGQPMSAKLNAYPDWEIPAEVIAVIPTADRSKATVKVRVALKQKDDRVLPDMGVRVSFLNEQNPQAAVEAPKGVQVPLEAILAEGSDSLVFVIAGGKAERRAIKLGGSDAQGAVVLAGLTDGEEVAVGDLKRLADGVAVEIVP